MCFKEEKTMKTREYFQRPSLILLGVLPDMVHLVHLAVAVDVITSCLLDWSDDRRFFNETSRDKRPTLMWNSYRSWCESQHFDLHDRASRKLFTTTVLKPDAGKYVEVRQKTLNAMGARYMVFWLSNLAKQFAEWTGSDEDMKLLWKFHYILLAFNPLGLDLFGSLFDLKQYLHRVPLGWAIWFSELAPPKWGQ